MAEEDTSNEYSEDQESQHQLYWSGDTDSGPAYPQPYVFQSSSSPFSTRPPLRAHQSNPPYPPLLQSPSLYQDRHTIVSGPLQPTLNTMAMSSFNTSAYQPGPSTPQLYDPLSNLFSVRSPMTNHRSYPFNPPLVQSPYPYMDTNTGPAHHTTALTSTYQPGPATRAHTPLYGPSTNFQSTSSTTLPWMSQNLFPPPPFRPPSPHQAVFTYSPQGSITHSLPTGPGPPGLLPGQPVNTFVTEMAEEDISNDERLARELGKAVNDGDVETVRSLLGQGANPDHQLYWSDGWSRDPLLHTASSKGNVSIVKMLIEAGADVDRHSGVVGYTPLHYACEGGHKEVVDYLIREAGCKVDVRNSINWTPLHACCRNGHKEVIQYLVEEVKCDVDVRDETGRTHLHICCIYGHKEVIQYLVEEVKCDVDARDDFNSSPLHQACEGGHVAAIEYLIEKANCDINARDQFNRSPLHLACERGNVAAIEYLIEKANCDVNVRDWNNQTPLHMSCGDSVSWSANLDIVRYLVERAHCDVNVTDDKGKTPLDLITEKSTVAYLGQDKREECTKIIDYLKSLPTEHSGQKRVSSENHERRSPPAKQSAIQEALQAESAQSQVLSEPEAPSGTPLSEEDSDALERLLQKAKVKLPPSQLTFERVQQLLLEGGHKDLATNLRAELHKVIKQQKQYLKQLKDLMSDMDTIDIRYLKTFLVGPPGVGKTTTLNRLLKVITNILSAGDKAIIPSTLLANCIQVFAFVSGDGAEWIPCSNCNQETKFLFRYLCGCKLEDVVLERSNRMQSQPMSYPRNENSDQMDEQEKSDVLRKSEKSQNASTSMPKEVTTEGVTLDHYTKIQQSRIHSFIARLQKLIISEDHSAFLNLLGSTLLNINDIGGQPGFLEMLPTLSTGPAMYLVFFDLSKDLDKPYEIPFNRENTVITPYVAMHTVKATISQILSAITSVHCISSETSLLNITKAVDFGEKFKCFQQVKPIAALIGTHEDQLKENVEQKLENIDKSLNDITCRYSKIFSRPHSSKCFFAVDNQSGTDQYDVGPIRDFMNKIFQTHFKDASLPIRPKWLWLSLILRREFRIVSKVVCLEIAEALGMDRAELDFALWYLHFCTGSLMYYPDISDEWFENHIICSPQVVFDSISQLIVASISTLHSKDSVTEFESEEMIQKGQFSLESIEEYCSQYQVKKNLQQNDLIPAKQLVKLLDYINLLSPIVHKEADGSERITYFMPAVLDCVSPDALTTRTPPDINNPEPLFITFSCGYVPTGTFCGLITRLVSLGPHKILGLTWELVENSVKRNCVSFFVAKTIVVTLIAHERCCEIRIIHQHYKIRLSDICSHVISVIFFTFKSLYKQLRPQISFQCPCPDSCRGSDHLCILDDDGLWIQFLCANTRISLRKYQEIWLGEPATLDESADLEVLKYAEDGFSFRWTKEGSRRQIKTTSEPNVLTFQTVSEKDLGYYRCEVKEAERVILTVYRALYIDKSNNSHAEPSSSGSIRQTLGKRPPESSQAVESDAKRPKQRSLSDTIRASDHQEVFERLVGVSVQWHELGGALGLDQDTLSAIDTNHRGNVQVCLREMLAKRLQSGGPLSWRVLCDCLRSPTVRRDDVAAEIERGRGDQTAECMMTVDCVA